MIITIGSECGCGGHEIAEKLAKRFGIELYDRKRLMELAKELGEYEETRDFYNETPIDSLLYSIVMNEEPNRIGRVPFEMLRGLAEKKPFVILGRCSDYILRDCKGVTSVFIHGEVEDRIRRVMEEKKIDRKKALEYIKQKDRNREVFYKNYTGGRWQELSNYHLTMNSSLIGIDRTVDVIAQYIENKR